MSACLVNLIEDHKDLIEIADVDSVIAATIQNGSIITSCDISLKEYVEEQVEEQVF